ncbi:putative LTP1-protein-tyrosine-phosphatase [Thelephora terrestris]|uniref:LTP1-protein-tyrosine-phosphatase n=1 Tax=Thelephora terrestris TaxID=56493 RepID=A0A9P6L1H5_9AGAM|nr:putative LTP1-protein-tyrosine-phosphatase [Thelephora terrestris]
MVSTNPSVLIVCLGNICRSPLGEAVLQHVAKQRGLEIFVDSAGTAGYHVGEEADTRTIDVCKKHGVPINGLARQVSREDFNRFTHILAADESNLANLQRIRPENSKAEVRLFGSYDDNRPIADPYYGGISGFERCYEQCLRYSNKFLDEIVGTTSTATTSNL